MAPEPLGRRARSGEDDPNVPFRKRFCKGLLTFINGETGAEKDNSTVASSDAEQEPRPTGAGDGVDCGEEEEKILQLLSALVRKKGVGNQRIVGPNTEEVSPTKSEELPDDKKSWKEVWKKKCEAKLPFLRTVFSVSNTEPSVCRAMLSVGQMSAKGEEKTVSLKGTVEETGKWLNAVRFAKQPGSAKAVWLTPAGQIQSEFRNIIMREVLRNAQNNPRKYINSGEEGVAVNSGGKIPEWLHETFIKGIDVQTVLERKEGKGTSKGRRLRKKQVKDGDVACYALEYLYTQLSKVLISSRRRVDEAFFSRFGYIFVNWREMPVTKDGQENYINQGTLVIMFPFDTGGGGGGVAVETVGTTDENEKTDTTIADDESKKSRGDTYCHIDNCIMEEDQPGARNKAEKHKCADCGRAIHTRCAEKRLGYVANEEGDLIRCSYCHRLNGHGLILPLTEEKKLIDVPETDVVIPDCDLKVIDERNGVRYKLAELVCEDLVVDLTHEVVVRERGVWKKTIEERRIELLQLAVVMIMTFSGTATKEEMMRAHGNSLKKAAGLARLLYELAKNYKTALDATADNYVEDLNSISAGGVSLDVLMPGNYRSKEIMRKGPCLTGESTGR